MKTFLFLISHLYSGADEFRTALNNNPRIEILSPARAYEHPLELLAITKMPHKFPSEGAVYGDHLVYNYSFGSRTLYPFAKFIYFMRPAAHTLGSILADKSLNYDINQAVNYYTFRLRRMYEMSASTPGALILTWEEAIAGKGLDSIQSYLGLKTPIQPPMEVVYPFKEPSPAVVRKCQDIYEKYLYLTRRNLKTV